MEKCRNFKKCGGCQLPNLKYSEQLAYKQRQAEFLLGKFCKVNSIIPAESPLHYRNKATSVFMKDSKTGKTVCGVYQDKTKCVIPIEHCLLEDVRASEINKTICRLADSFKLKPYNAETKTGALRHTLIRTGNKTGQIMVVIITATEELPKERSFVNALLKARPEITTLVHNVNKTGEALTLGESSRVLFGKGYIEAELCDCRFKISPEAFFQINPVQTEKLYGKAMEFAALTGKERIFDAYCGTGTIGIIAAKSAREAMGVEINHAAVKDAKMNAEMNDCKSISFACEDAGKYLAKAAKSGEKFDIIFTDPPRAGTTLRFLKSAVTAAPKRIVYISCNPKTLARDLSYLTDNGYRVCEIQPVDMFPMTKHIETVVLIVRNKTE